MFDKEKARTGTYLKHFLNQIKMTQDLTRNWLAVDTKD